MFLFNSSQRRIAVRCTAILRDYKDKDYLNVIRIPGEAGWRMY